MKVFSLIICLVFLLGCAQQSPVKDLKTFNNICIPSGMLLIELNAQVYNNYLAQNMVYSETAQYDKLINLVVSEGLLVMVIYVDEPAWESGIRKYDVITEVNGNKVFSYDDFVDEVNIAYESSNYIPLKVIRGAQILYVNLQLN